MVARRWVRGRRGKGGGRACRDVLIGYRCRLCDHLVARDEGKDPVHCVAKVRRVVELGMHRRFAGCCVMACATARILSGAPSNSPFPCRMRTSSVASEWLSMRRSDDVHVIAAVHTRSGRRGWRIVDGAVGPPGTVGKSLVAAAARARGVTDVGGESNCRC